MLLVPFFFLSANQAALSLSKSSELFQGEGWGEDRGWEYFLRELQKQKNIAARRGGAASC